MVKRIKRIIYIYIYTKNFRLFPSPANPTSPLAFFLLLPSSPTLHSLDPKRALCLMVLLLQRMTKLIWPLDMLMAEVLIAPLLYMIEVSTYTCNSHIAILMTMIDLSDTQ